MAKEGESSEIIEQGEIFFFYRPNVDAEEVKGVEVEQRLHVITSIGQPGGKKVINEKVNESYLLGQKQSPQVVESKSPVTERSFASNIPTTCNPGDTGKELSCINFPKGRLIQYPQKNIHKDCGLLY